MSLPPQEARITPERPTAHHFALTGNSAELRKEIKPELVGKVKYNDESVFRRLGVFDIDDDLVSGCHEAYQRVREEDLNTLINITAPYNPTGSRSAQSESQLTDDANNIDQKVANRLEKSMYGPLVRIVFLFLYVSTQTD